MMPGCPEEVIPLARAGLHKNGRIRYMTHICVTFHYRAQVPSAVVPVLAAFGGRKIPEKVRTVYRCNTATFMPAYWCKDLPWVDPQSYWDRSPLSLLGNVTAPAALLTGEQDHRTPITGSEQYYQALKLRRTDTALIRVPEASHGIAARPSHLIAKVDNILAWFARYARWPG